MAIVLDNSPIDFDNLTLGIPNQLQKNVYFSRIFLNDNPIYIQTNECFTNTGIKETNTKSFCDFIYTNNESIVTFFSDLEKKIKECVLNNKEDWFEDNFTSDDLEDSFMSTIAYHRQGVKLRTYIHKNTITERYTLNCYNYNHELISNEKICIGTRLIPIIEIVGIRFTDKNFNVEIKLVQALITNVDLDENINKSMFLGSISSDTMIKQKQSKNIIDEEDNEEMKLEMDDSSENLNFENVCDKKPEPIEKKPEPIEKNLEPIEKEQEAIEKEQEAIEKETDTIEKESIDENENLQIKTNDDNKIGSIDNSENLYKEKISTLENIKDCIEEIELSDTLINDVPIKLKTHSDIYKEIWKMYRDDAFKIRRQNIKFLLNSKNIHTNYLINEI